MQAASKHKRETQQKKAKRRGDRVLIGCPLRYKQNHIRFLAKGCEILQSYIDWLDDDEDEEEEINFATVKSYYMNKKSYETCEKESTL